MSTNIEPLRVIIADDHVLYRAGVKTALSAKKDIKIISEADNGMHLLNLHKNIEADVILKGTSVDGIYTADPKKDATATKFDTISFDEVMMKNLRIMDQTDFVLCKENKMPIIVFNIKEWGNILSI